MSDINIVAGNENLAPITRASAAQRHAADPGISAFVSANAGSGKTKVLVDRVLRLLLEGTAPGKILCLTYTKAAAAHMAVKVFDRLAGWVTLPDAALAAELAKLEGSPPQAQRLLAARRLFARAVETPGGLKIETIHAFCERLLHLVPFEANVPARFEVLDEAASEELLTEATRTVLTEAARGGPLLGALAVVSLEAVGDRFTDAIRAALRERAFLREDMTEAGGLDAAMAALARTLGLAPGQTRAEIERAMLEDGLDPGQWADIAHHLNAGKATDKERASDLLAALAAEQPGERLEHYLRIFFTQSNEPRSDRMVTKAIEAGLAASLLEERDRLVDLVDLRRAALTLERTSALLMLAAAVMERVEARKHARGALDFDDLIGKARTLLLRSEAASWVLHKLDAGIDHVLVDEAQDTNPAQWDILRALTGEFTAGEGAASGDADIAGRPRTVFAVGDPKQSIYGFQGADPRAFADSERHFRRATQQGGGRFSSVPLNVSFRSAPAVLAAVDIVFGLPEHFAGLSFESDEDLASDGDAGAAQGRPGTVHETSRMGQHGHVEVWLPVAPEAESEPDAWEAPVDAPDAASPAVRLAQRIAEHLARMIRDGDEHGHRPSPGDVLVLVRKRGALFEAIIRALKAARLPVAGADRLKLGEHIAVLDLVAAGQAVLLPDDDLKLATVLKSPLIGLDDDDLIAIGARRGPEMSFAAALAQAAHQGEPQAVKAQDKLGHWRDLAGRLGPFGFYASLLGPLGGRTALVSRLGPEAGDAIDEFLALALGHEQRETPSLAGFLARFGDASHDVKRDMDATRGEIRVMTVHGAKGLEADLVVLADACRYDERLPTLLPIDSIGPNGSFRVPVWLPPAKARPRALASACDAAREREREEHNRLLYVAMTRARDRLIVAPYLGKAPSVPPAASWYGMIDAALSGTEGFQGLVPRQTTDPLSGELIQVLSSGTPGAAPPGAAPAPAAPQAPAWLSRPLPREAGAQPPLSPSAALSRNRTRDASMAETTRRGASVRDDAQQAEHHEARANARLGGTLLHALLEHLPALEAEQRAPAALRFLATRGSGLPDAQRADIARQALALIEEPSLQALFGPGSRGEVAIAGHVALAHRRIAVSGQIDRLVVTPEAVLIVDFKSAADVGGAARPDRLPEKFVAQLALYAELVRQAIPEKPVRAFLVFASGPSVVELSPERMAAALDQLSIDRR